MISKQRVLWVLPLLALVSFRCTTDKQEQGSPSERAALTQLREAEHALSEELMLSLGQAKNFHHKADVLLSDGKVDEAAEQVAKILEIPFPADSPESQDVLLDTRARLAKLRVVQGRLVDAMSLVDQGIRTTSRESFFLANLHTVRGEVFEAKAAMAEEGSEESDQAKREAIKAFDTSIKINERLLETLGAKSGEDKP